MLKLKVFIHPEPNSWTSSIVHLGSVKWAAVAWVSKVGYFRIKPLAIMLYWTHVQKQGASSVLTNGDQVICLSKVKLDSSRE